MSGRGVAVIGAGAWGTALATVAARAGAACVLWARDAAVAADINARHENVRRLPGLALDPAIRATADPAEAAACPILVMAVPTQRLREAAERMAPLLAGRRPLVVSAAKGLERGSERLPTQVLEEVLPAAECAVLSGPSFALDVARGLPTAVTLACAGKESGARLVGALGHATFRPYLTDDVVGTQIGGAVKNVLAIACGAVAGRSLGASAQAALIARGFAEMNRLATAMGANPETLAGLSGLGDLVLTATSAQSRNFSLGLAIGRAASAAEAMAAFPATAEGAWTAPALVARARALGIDMPISQAVDDVLSGASGIDEAVETLLSRPFRTER